MQTNMEKDVRAYGQPLTKDTEELQPPPAVQRASERVEVYRSALAAAARTGTLDDERGAQIAGDSELGLAAASPSAAALVAFERALHSARQGALSWSNGKTDRDSKVLALESLASDAAERLQVDLIYLGL
jgi:hypothetical protein